MKGKSDVASIKRRALGDITNAISSDQEGNATKKPVFGTVYDSKAFSAAGVTSMVTEDSEDPRSYMQRPTDDIDERDVDNPMACSEYVIRMYENFNQLERQYMAKNYLADQPNITEKMRSILVDWLVEVHLKFKMVPETLFLTVNLIDRYLTFKQVRRSKLQLVGVAALSLASKYEEIYPPQVKDLVYITDRAYNKQEILEMETDIANTLEYQLTVPTIHSFLCRALKAAHADRTMVQLACYLAERSLQEFSMIKYLPSVIAATAVLIARKTLKRHSWSPTLLLYTKYDEDDLALCAADMQVYLADTSIQQQAVNKKYQNPKFGSVSKLSISH